MSECLSIAEFIDLLSGDESRRTHLLRCARCRTLAGAIRTSRGLADLDAAVAEIERRRDDASAAVAELETALPHRWTDIARADTRLHGPEGIRALLSRAAASWGTMPRRALALAQAAQICCEGASVPAFVRFEMLKDLARYSLQGADDLTAAIGALDEAEKIVPSTEDPIYFAAVLAYARACVWGDATCGQWDEALRNLDLCDAVLKQRDVSRWRGAAHFRAAVLVRRGDYDKAAKLFEELLTNSTDEYSRALLSGDLADCVYRMGRPAEALTLLDEAIPVFLRRSEKLRWARALWVRGDALAAMGEHDEAVRVLTVASGLFAAAGLNDDELGVELSTLRILRTKDASADVRSRLEQAYLLASALDAEQPFRSGARRAAVWAELCEAYAAGSLTVDSLASASDRLRRDFEAQNRRHARVD